MTLSNNLISARVQQQFIAVVNGLHGDGEVLKGEEGLSKSDKKAFHHNEKVLN